MEEIIINVDAFIVPNSLHSCLDFSEVSQNRVVEHILNFNRANGTTFNAVTEPLVELWYSGKTTCDSENLQDHGFSINGVQMHLKAWSDLVPLSILRGKKDGDIVSIAVTAYANKTSDTPETECTITLNCRLAQKEYRYRRNGDFDDCLTMLNREYQARHANAAVTA